MNKYSFSSELVCQDLTKIKNDFNGVTSFSERLKKLQKWRPNCIKGLPPKYLRKEYVKDKNKVLLPRKVKIKRDCITDLVLLCSKGKKAIERGLATFFKKYYSLRNVSNYSREWLIFAQQKDFLKMKNNKAQQKLDDQQNQPKQFNKLSSSKRSKSSNKRKRSNKLKTKRNIKLSTNLKRGKFHQKNQEKKSKDAKHRKKKFSKSTTKVSSFEERAPKINQFEKFGKIHFQNKTSGEINFNFPFKLKKHLLPREHKKLRHSVFDLQQEFTKKFQSQKRKRKRRLKKTKKKLLQEPIHKKSKYSPKKRTQRRLKLKKKIVLCPNYKKFLTEKKKIQQERFLKQEHKGEQKIEHKLEQKYEHKLEKKYEQKQERELEPGQLKLQEEQQEKLKPMYAYAYDYEYEYEKEQIQDQIHDHTQLQIQIQEEEEEEEEDCYENKFEKKDPEQKINFKIEEPLEMFSIPILDSSPVTISADDSNQGFKFTSETESLLTEEFVNLKNVFTPFMDEMFDDFDCNAMLPPNDDHQFSFD
ncbi:hypothetical protein M0813_07755 [Anaeramoeba flamelloides]|uniref:Uncharacterized protein n=1 Tax=Anaeramoeba flamelloides TaxID=1746091 RepID=A0ABQ8XA20_9EUKA|nr:hypothetical protein M0813_07755 [Anaeramoeba flamelloides]